MLATAVSHYPKVGDGPGQQRLRQAINKRDRGEFDQAEVESIAADLTVDVLREQADAGLDLVTDGQIRWQDPVTYIARGLGGFEITGLLRWFESNTYFRQPLATGPIEWKKPVLVDDYRFAREHSDRPVKAIVTGPYTIATLSHTRHHGTHRDFVLDTARALNQELRALAAEQPAWIQVDEPAIANNPSVRYPRDFGLFSEAMNVLTDGVSAPLSLYVYHGSAEDVPGLLDLPFGLFGFDLVQGAASWALLDRWPSGKGLGLGVVDARNVRLEDPARLAEAVQRGVRAAGADNVHVSPSCGLEFLPRDVARAKLGRVAEAAHELVPA